MKIQENILQEDFTAAPCMIEGHEVFMGELMNIVTSEPMSETVGERVKAHVLDFVRSHPLTCFDRFSEDTYVRNYIGRDTSTGWEAIVMSWKKGNRTAIHSHPQFAGYTFADGEFLVEIFEPCKGGICLVDELRINDVLGLYAIGEAGKFDNHIHRITCLSDTAHSLHVYSDDALKGRKWEEQQVFKF